VQVRKDFLNPDEAWKDVDVIVFTSKLSVAVDPKTTFFGHLFIITSHPYGCNTQDLF
jgi:hypothetical protein